MGNIGSITASSYVPDDLAKRLGSDGVEEILTVLWQGYHDLIIDSPIEINTNTQEDMITQEWYGKVVLRWNDKNRATIINEKVEPIHQYSDPTLQKCRGKAPTIDFCFRDWGVYNSYFGVECKNLHENYAKDIKRYFETGIENYTLGRYGFHSSESAIVGYVLSGKVKDFVSIIFDKMNHMNHLMENLTREIKFSDPQYYSRHIRLIDKYEIVLHHLFFDFTQSVN